MPYLSAGARRALPRSAFGMPDERKYPIRVPGEEKEFAKSALRLRNRGKGMTSADKARIIRMSTKILYGTGVTTEAALKKLQQKSTKRKTR